MDKPFYKIKFSSTSCNFEIRINDMPVFSYVDTGMISTQYPINHLILKSGNQGISLKLWPQKSQANLTEHSKLQISILVNDTSEPSNIPTEVYVFQTPLFDKPIPLFEYKTNFKATVPYLLKGWTDSSILQINQSLTDKVFAFYNNIHTILKEKDFVAYKKIYLTKLKEVDTSIYSSQADTDSEWEELVTFLNDPEMQIAPISKNASLFLYGDEKVISLQQPNLEPALFFENKTKKTQYQIPLFLHKPKESDRLEVIR
ncbi:hypothetical protein [Pseudozobellia thermophila]|uniref:Uncharacterized protein n=1 Tax=Pseudozobellia thermophila TaxID=192903 RepID=A0A1M6PFX2_9FLAO|nr:hypothetical protein [Pseudozobellia thermophila]SHK06846.1 hypothetical protein SAMN04488513_1216 [Pseudozobellia thermophila]